MAKEWNADDQVFFLNILTTAEQWNFFVIVGGTQISLLVDYARVVLTTEALSLQILPDFRDLRQEFRHGLVKLMFLTMRMQIVINYLFIVCI